MSKNNPCIKAQKAINKGNIKKGENLLLNCKKFIKKNIRDNAHSPDQVLIYRFQLVNVLQLESKILFSQGKSIKAKKIIEEALLILQNCPESKNSFKLFGQLYYSLATIQLEGEKLDIVTDLLVKSYMYLLKADNKVDAINVIFRLSDLYFSNNQISVAEKILGDVSKINKKVKDKKVKLNNSARLLLYNGKIASGSGSAKDAEKWFRKAQKEFEKNNNLEAKAWVFIELGKLFETTDLTKTEEFYLEALDLGKLVDSIKVKGSALTKLGIIALKSGRLKLGQKRLLKGLNYRQESGDTTGTVDTLIELTRITLLTAQNEKDLKKAENFAFQALTIAKKSLYWLGEANAAELLAIILRRSNKLHDAKSYIKTSQKLFKKLNDLNGQARSLTQLAIFYEIEGNLDTIQPLLRKAETFYSKTNNTQGLAEVYQLQGRYGENPHQSINLLKKSRELYFSLSEENQSINSIITVLDKQIEGLQNQID